MMLINIFTWLTESLSANIFMSLFASFLWGVLSIILSPCHLASIPLIIGFIDDQGKISTKKAFLISLFFSVGILVTIAVIGTVTALLGRMMGDLGKSGDYFVAIIFFVIGIHLLEIISLSFKGANISWYKSKGLLSGFILGLIFGIALGPCTFAYMAPILTVALTVAKYNFIKPISLLLFYGIGHCSVIVFAGTFTEVVQNYLNWNEKSNIVLALKKVCGILVIIAGIYLVLR